jgi:hypothetical protein
VVNMEVLVGVVLQLVNRNFMSDPHIKLSNGRITVIKDRYRIISTLVGKNSPCRLPFCNFSKYQEDMQLTKSTTTVPF